MKEKTMSDEVKLLDARKSAIEEIIKVLDDEECDSDDPTIKAIHSLIVSACKDAAGMGFDAGIKYKSYTTNSPASDL